MNEEIITSRQNSTVRTVCAISEKKARKESGLFRFDGIKLLGEAIASGMDIRYVVYNAEASERVVGYVREKREELELGGARMVAVSASVFDKISEEKAPEGIVTVAAVPSALKRRYSSADDIPAMSEKILVAQSLRDPANLGTIMRSAYALGIDRLVLTDDCAEIYSPKTLRAAMGAAFRLSVLEVEQSRFVEFIGELRKQGRRVFATALSDNSATLGSFDMRACDCFVIGNEGHGLSNDAISACDGSVIIPMREGAESLNAAAAAAICIWETVTAK